MNKIKPMSGEKMMEADMPKKMYPMFHIGLEHLPEAKNWKPGETYQVGLQIKMTGMDMHKDDKNSKERGNVNFDITGIEVQKAKANPIKKANRYVK